MIVKPLPCPYCGRIPEVVRFQFKQAKPRYLVTHPTARCTVYDTVDYGTNLFLHPSDAIRDWNQYATLAKSREGMNPWF